MTDCWLFWREYIYIIIKSYWEQRVPWLFLTIHPDSLHWAGSLGCILCLHRSDVCKSLLITQHLHVRVFNRTLLTNLPVHPYFSISLSLLLQFILTYLSVNPYLFTCSSLLLFMFFLTSPPVNPYLSTSSSLLLYQFILTSLPGCSYFSSSSSWLLL